MLTRPQTFGTCRDVQDLSRWRSEKKLNYIFNSPNPTLCPNGRNSTFCLHGQMSTLNFVVRLQLLNTMVGRRLLNTMVGPQLLNTMVGPQLNLFQNLPNSQPISSKPDVIHTPASFSVWGLLWQWWLSYPLRASERA